MKINATQKQCLSAIATAFRGGPVEALIAVEMLDTSSLPQNCQPKQIQNLPVEDISKFRFIGKRFVGNPYSFTNYGMNPDIIHSAASFVIQVLRGTITNPSDVEAQLEAFFKEINEQKSIAIKEDMTKVRTETIEEPRRKETQEERKARTYQGYICGNDHSEPVKGIVWGR